MLLHWVQVYFFTEWNFPLWRNKSISKEKDNSKHINATVNILTIKEFLLFLMPTDITSHFFQADGSYI